MTTRLFGRLSAALGIQAVPGAGVLSGWSPATGLVLYWVESVVGLLLALAMIGMYDAIVKDPRSYLAFGPPGSPEFEGIRRERVAELQAANIRARDVALVHGAGFLIFGVFFSAVLLIASRNHGLAPPSLDDLRLGVPLMVALAALGFLLDAQGLSDRPASFVAARVDATNARFGILWVVAFFGTFLIVVTEKPTAIFLVFAVLKGLHELSLVIEKNRGAAASP
jgi:hypothetical protein